MANAQPTNQALTIAAPRLPYHPALSGPEFGIDQALWRVVVESVYPNAKTAEGVLLAIRYCKNRNLDILKRPVHVVPVWSSRLRKEVELVWPGIAEYRTTAARTGEYGGCEATECGPIVKETFSGSYEDDRQTKNVSAEVSFCEWMRVTVYRIVKGNRCPFPGPKVYFKEIYSRVRFNVDVPNDRWQKSPNGQLEKCAEAAALRKAFPEEIGGDYTAEEMEGKVVDIAPTPQMPTFTPEQASAMARSSSGAPPPPIAEEGNGEDPDDWTIVRDTLLVKLGRCMSGAAVEKFLGDQAADIEEMQDHAPQSIALSFAEAVERKRKSFEGGTNGGTNTQG